MELRAQIDDVFMSQLISGLGLRRAVDVVREALTLLNWALEERKRGRVILSADVDGGNVSRLAMPILEAVRPSNDTERRPNPAKATSG
jgi:hypothetical protein